MSKLEQLIQELCPNGVEYKSFGDVAIIQRGASPRPIASFITEDDNGIPWIKIGDTTTNSKYVSQTKQKITAEGAVKSRVLKKGDFIMSNSMSFGRPYILNIDGAIHDGWLSISNFGDNLNSDFLYHYLSSELVQNYWISKINSGSVSNLNSEIVKNLSIPIPPLAVQEEIVRILDNFTELTAELTTELTARKQQYEYYRDSLLTFGDDVEWKALGSTCHMKSGKAIKAIFINDEQSKENNYECYGGNGVRGYVADYSHSGEFPIIGRQGALCGNVNYAIGEFYATEHAVVVSGNDVVKSFVPLMDSKI